jgi:hypothetical protein
MLIKEIELKNYLFNTDIYEIPPPSACRYQTACQGNDRDFQRSKRVLMGGMYTQKDAPLYEALLRYKKTK